MKRFIQILAQRPWLCTIIVCVALYLLTFVMTKERVQPEAGQKTTLRSDIRDLRLYVMEKK